MKNFVMYCFPIKTGIVAVGIFCTVLTLNGQNWSIYISYGGQLSSTIQHEPHLNFAKQRYSINPIYKFGLQWDNTKWLLSAEYATYNRGYTLRFDELGPTYSPRYSFSKNKYFVSTPSSQINLGRHLIASKYLIISPTVGLGMSFYNGTTGNWRSDFVSPVNYHSYFDEDLEARLFVYRISPQRYLLPYLSFGCLTSFQLNEFIRFRLRYQFTYDIVQDGIASGGLAYVDKNSPETPPYYDRTQVNLIPNRLSHQLSFGMIWKFLSRPVEGK